MLAGCVSAPESAEDTRSRQEILFEDGNYAMFMHFGLYSSLESEWQGKAYYGNAEWIMHPSQAGIPCGEYMALASTFNPSGFDAEEIVRIAKDAGMKYIVITSKHHEGFAMFDSDACDFNIKDATPFGRDVIGELAEACHRNGLGIGFYYSQFQDWTAPGGGSGPETDADGRKVGFEEYFRTKCVPQVEELTTKYGEIQLIWFDTPGDMDAKYSAELVELVHKNQPGALVSSRVGNGYGDYESFGDMEVPVSNIPFRWEGLDVMQVGWGFSKFDNEWKSPGYVLRTLLSTVARGGTFMMNVGPTAKGVIPEQAAASLRKAGEWVHRYPEVVYGAGPSPWGHALPWGDAVTSGDKIYLLVYEWPADGRLILPSAGLDIKKARLFNGRKLAAVNDGSWMEIRVPYKCPDEQLAVIELQLGAVPQELDSYPVVPGFPSEFSTAFAETSECTAERTGYMVRYGEWKTLYNISDLSEKSSVTWTFDIYEPGWYDIELQYKDDRHGGDCSNGVDWMSAMSREGLYFAEWSVESDESETLIDKQPAYRNYTWQRMGWMKFSTPGRHSVTVRLVDGDWGDISLASLRVTQVCTR